MKLREILEALPNKQRLITSTTDRWPKILNISEDGTDVEAFMPTILQTYNCIGHYHYDLEGTFEKEDDGLEPERLLLKVTRESKQVRWNEYQTITKFGDDIEKKLSYINGLCEDEFPTTVMERKYFITTSGGGHRVRYDTHTAQVSMLLPHSAPTKLTIVRVNDAVWKKAWDDGTKVTFVPSFSTEYFDLVMSMKDDAQEIKKSLTYWGRPPTLVIENDGIVQRVGNHSLEHHHSENILDYICLTHGTTSDGWFILDIPCTVTLKKITSNGGFESVKVLKPGRYEVTGDFRGYLIEWPYEDKRIRGLSTNLRTTPSVMHDDSFLNRL
mgnify:CR=1 FL=1